RHFGVSPLHKIVSCRENRLQTWSPVRRSFQMKRVLLVSFGLMLAATYVGCLPADTGTTGTAGTSGSTTGTAGSNSTGSAGDNGTAGTSGQAGDNGTGDAGTTGSAGDN